MLTSLSERFFSLGCLLLAIIGTANSQMKCQEGNLFSMWSGDGMCYRYFAELDTVLFPAAKDECAKYGGYPTSVKSQEQEDFLVKDLLGGEPGSFWIGLYKDSRGNWFWYEDNSAKGSFGDDPNQNTFEYAMISVSTNGANWGYKNKNSNVGGLVVCVVEPSCPIASADPECVAPTTTSLSTTTTTMMTTTTTTASTTSTTTSSTSTAETTIEATTTTATTTSTSSTTSTAATTTPEATTMTTEASTTSTTPPSTSTTTTSTTTSSTSTAETTTEANTTTATTTSTSSTTSTAATTTPEATTMTTEASTTSTTPPSTSTTTTSTTTSSTSTAETTTEDTTTTATATSTSSTISKAATTTPEVTTTTTEASTTSTTLPSTSTTTTSEATSTTTRALTTSTTSETTSTAASATPEATSTTTVPSITCSETAALASASTLASSTPTMESITITSAKLTTSGALETSINVITTSELATTTLQDVSLNARKDEDKKDYIPYIIMGIVVGLAVILTISFCLLYLLKFRKRKTVNEEKVDRDCKNQDTKSKEDVYLRKPRATYAQKAVLIANRLSSHSLSSIDSGRSLTPTDIDPWFSSPESTPPSTTNSQTVTVSPIFKDLPPYTGCDMSRLVLAMKGVQTFSKSKPRKLRLLPSTPSPKIDETTPPSLQSAIRDDSHGYEPPITAFNRFKNVAIVATFQRPKTLQLLPATRSRQINPL